MSAIEEFEKSSERASNSLNFLQRALVARRREVGLSEDNLAERLGIPLRHLLEWERYERDLTMRELSEYALAVGLELRWWVNPIGEGGGV